MGDTIETNENKDDAIELVEADDRDDLEAIIKTLRAMSERLSTMDGKAAFIRREIDSALRFA